MNNVIVASTLGHLFYQVILLYELQINNFCKPASVYALLASVFHPGICMTLHESGQMSNEGSGEVVKLTI